MLVGFRIQDLFDEKILRQKVDAALVGKNQMLVKIYNRNAVDPNEVADYLLGFAEQVRPFVVDVLLWMSGGESSMRSCWTPPFTRVPGSRRMYE